MPDHLLQTAPRERKGAGWAVFNHLVHEEPTAVNRMTREQQLVFAINYLRQEVNSGGFDAYLRYSGGNTLPLAREASSLLGPDWVALVDDVLDVLGTPHPRDIDERTARLDDLLSTSPGLLEAFDNRLYDLEAAQAVDEQIDEFIWANPMSFFSQIV